MQQYINCREELIEMAKNVQVDCLLEFYLATLFHSDNFVTLLRHMKELSLH